MPNVDLTEDEVVLALSEDSTALQTYAIGFWKPLPLQKPYQERFYHIQSGAGGDSPLLQRLAPTMNRLVDKIVQKADFLQVKKDVMTVMHLGHALSGNTILLTMYLVVCVSYYVLRFMFWSKA